MKNAAHTEEFCRWDQVCLEAFLTKWECLSRSQRPLDWAGLVSLLTAIYCQIGNEKFWDFNSAANTLVNWTTHRQPFLMIDWDTGNYKLDTKGLKRYVAKQSHNVAGISVLSRFSEGIRRDGYCPR